jgi:hypothetical protein
MTSAELEVIRKRWVRARRVYCLADPSADGFGSGPLGQFVGKPSVQLLILPADPQLNLVEFDGETWEWWLQDRIDPATTQKALWSHDSTSTSDAMVRFWPQRDHPWYRYVALNRSAGLEMGLGNDGAGVRSMVGPCFRISRIVARVWTAIDLFTKVQERYSMKGPYEITLGLIGTKEGWLSALASERGDMIKSGSEPSIELPDGILMRRELMDCIEPTAAHEIA